MKNLLTIAFTIAFSMSILFSFAQKRDTVAITGRNLHIENLKKGKATYVLYNKKIKEGPPSGITLVKLNVESIKYNNKEAIAITQQWDSDTAMIHTSHTILNASDFSTLLHEYYWKKSDYSVKFNFENKNVLYTGEVPEQIQTKAIKNFNESFQEFNLNWHSDLIIFSLLPYKKNRTFKINFYDPGFGKPKEVFYAVIGTDYLTNSAGTKIKCWILEYEFPIGKVLGISRFWISQKSKEVIKEEDNYTNTFGYRYKLKLLLSEDK